MMTSDQPHRRRHRAASRLALLLTSAAALGLAACNPSGGDTSGENAASSANTAGTPTPMEAVQNSSVSEADQNAQSASPVSEACPGSVVPPVHSLDFWGVKLGMTLEETRNLLNCLGPDFKIRSDFRLVVIDNSPTVKMPELNVSRGEFGQQDELKVNFAGTPGQERVVQVIKSISFGSRTPGSRKALEREMAERYESPVRTEPRVHSLNMYSVVRDNSGNKMDPKDYVYNLCAGFAVSDNGSFSSLFGRYSPKPDKCGLIFSYNIHAKSDIDDQVGFITLGTMDYTKTVAALREGVQYAMEHDNRN